MNITAQIRLRTEAPLDLDDEPVLAATLSHCRDMRGNRPAR
jgi:hypothetical protein